MASSNSSWICAKLEIEDQVILSRALMGRHPMTTECYINKGRLGIQLLAQNKPHEVFDLMERMTDSVLMENMEFCSAICCSHDNNRCASTDHPTLLVNLGSTIACEFESDRRIAAFTAESGSVVRVPPKSSLLYRVLPNTCPAALGHIPQDTSITVSFRTFDPCFYDELGHALFYNKCVLKGAQDAFKRVVTHLSPKDKANILRGLWPSLPTEISHHIIRQLDAKGLMTFCCISSGARTLVYNDSELWRAADVTQSHDKELTLATSYRLLNQREMRKKDKRSDEVAAMVIAIGSHHIDVGMAGEDCPDIVVPSLLREVRSFNAPSQLFAGHEAKHLSTGTTLPVVQQKQIANTEHLLNLIEHVYASHPWAKFEEYPLLLSISARHTQSDYDKLMYKCLQRFNMPCIYVAEAEALALYSLGQTNGIVVNVGYECTTIAPVEEGYTIRADMRVVPVGGRHVTLELLKRIRAQYPALSDLTEEEASDIKEKYCYFKTTSPYTSFYEGDREVLIRGEYYRLGEVLHESCEVLFHAFNFRTGTSDFKGQYSSMLESFEHNHPKPNVVNNVALVGGTTLLPGYGQRFCEVVKEFYKDRPSWNLRAGSYRGYVEWIGGSILGSLTCSPFFLTTEQLKDRVRIDEY